MTGSVVSIVYVNDVRTAARFYGELFGLTPSLETPGYVSFDLGPGAALSLWSGRFDGLSPDVPRTGEVCLAISGTPGELDAICERWRSQGVTILREPHDAGFGRTFLAADPDGNLIRVAPKD